ncbi:MAG: DUF3408 domain-containing protein [Muribaculum sp.]|nr:DUF3408 domain-containing protein [Muribaculum sp.]
MSKVYESDINPDEFIRSFREEPSQLPTPKKKKERGPEYEKEKSKETVSTDSTSNDEEYLTRFVRNMEHMRPIDKYLMVEIHPKFIRMIKRILSYESGQVCSLKAYINNVLEEHFREYESSINKRL